MQVTNRGGAETRKQRAILSNVKNEQSLQILSVQMIFGAKVNLACPVDPLPTRTPLRHQTGCPNL